MNYNSLMNKPTINYRELIGDNTVTEVGGITEEQFNTLLNTDLASYYTKAQIDELFARSYVFREKSGSIVTFDCPSSTPAFYQIGSDIVAVQSGSGDPSPSNIRPITGFSAVNMYRTGKNLFGGELMKNGIKSAIPSATINESEKSITFSSSAVTEKAFTSECGLSGKFKDNTVYTFIITMSATRKSSNMRIWYTDGTSLNVPSTESENTKETIVVVSSSNKTINYITKSNMGGNTTIYYDESGIFEGNLTADNFVAYNGTTYTTQLKDGQGNPLTCYGGGLMNAGGSQALLVTKGHIASYNGETLPSTWLSDRDVYAAGTTPSIGAEVVYELETPLQIPQDSLSIVSTGGTNNIWCDTGDITVKALDRIIQG